MFSLKKYDYGLLLFIICSRLFFIWYLYPDKARMFNGDSQDYETLALELLRNGRYYIPERGIFSDVLRPPGYPIFILLNYIVFGPNFLFPILWNIIGTIATYFGIRKLIMLCGDAPYALVMAFFAVDMAWLFYAKELVTEPVFTPLFVYSIILLIEGCKPRNLTKILASGLLLGICTLIKPITLYLWLPMAIYIACNTRSRLKPALYILFFVVAISPWLIRNKMVHDSYSFTSTQNNNIANAHAAYILAEINNTRFIEAQEELDTLFQERVTPAILQSYKATDSLRLQIGKEILLQHPFLYAKAIARGMLVTLFDPGRLIFNRTFPSEDVEKMGFNDTLATEGVTGTVLLLLKKDTTMVICLVLYMLFLSVLNLLTLFGIVPLYVRSKSLFVLITLVVFYLLFLGGPNGYDRFRLYIFPFWLVYAHFGAKWLKQKWEISRNKALILPAKSI